VPSHTAWNRILALAIVSAMATTILGFYISSYLEDRASHAFEQVNIGATQQQVVALLGVPDAVRACGDSLWWGDDTKHRGENDGRCVTEARYDNFLSTWAVGYSQDRHVVSKYHYSSD
jgi:hypothetical protein